jgi:hypothetical protein
MAHVRSWKLAIAEDDPTKETIHIFGSRSNKNSQGETEAEVLEELVAEVAATSGRGGYTQTLDIDRAEVKSTINQKDLASVGRALYASGFKRTTY